MDNRQWREFLDTAIGVPPGRLTVASVRRRLLKRRVTEAVGAAAVVAVAVLGATAAVEAFGPAPGPAAEHRPAAPSIVYVGYRHGLTGMLTPINPATNKPGKPINVPCSCDFASTSDGKTLYVATQDAIIPISTATNTPGKPIHIGTGRAYWIAIDPNGKTAYATGLSGMVTPINLATNTAGKPINIGLPGGIAFTPDGKTAYMVIARAGPSTVIPINTATNTPGKPIPAGSGADQIAITPDGKTLYVADLHAVTPISTATNTPGKPIRVPAPAEEIAITANGKTVYVASFEGNRFVTPISTATNRAGRPIHIGRSVMIAITPDGKTLYATSPSAVIPVNTATNTPGKPIPVHFGIPEDIAITP
jgi:DNA-binding beta-propeller fold protein YncE